MIRLPLNIYNYHRLSTRRFASHDFNNVFNKTIRDLSEFGFMSVEGKAVLDLGCGQRFPFSLLAAAAGANATALDINYVKRDYILKYFFKIVQKNGLQRAFKSLLRRGVFDRFYYDQIASLSGHSFRKLTMNIEFVVADPTSANYPLSDASFDLITSNAVLEHVSDISKYFSEVLRLLKKGGIFYGIVHNYFSISGGHNLEWAFPEDHPSATVPPWDHLRKNLFPPHVYLNGLKPKQYEMAAASQLQVLLFQGRDINHDAGGLEGTRFLTPDVQSELQAYSKELLLTRSYCIICQK